MFKALLKSLNVPGFRQPDFIAGGKEDPYLNRWYLIPRNRFFNIYLHQFLRDDDDRALHDHPWYSLSVILKTGYIEHLPNKQIRTFEAGDWVFRKPEHAHRIELWLDDQINVPAWTLFITGPVFRDWGFHCPKGWVHWKDFTDPTDPGKRGKGCD